MSAISVRSSIAVAALLAACGSSDDSPSPPPPQLRIVATSGVSLSTAFAGDAIPLDVALVASDGTKSTLPDGAVVTFVAPSKLTALAPATVAPVLLNPSVTGQGPTATFVDNPGRADRAASLANVLFILDPGTLQNGVVHVSATVTNIANAGTVDVDITVLPAPLGDARRGATLYGPHGANCGRCHGATGHGSPEPPDSKTFKIDGMTYDFPALGLNAEPGNLANDPAWNAALLAFSARSDVDNAGVTLRAPMPDWLKNVSPAVGKPLSTQDLADIYAFLRTQTE
jgi:mono/diheme cytochrome c family protein